MGKSFRTATERQHSAWVDRARARQLQAADRTGRIAESHDAVERFIPDAPRAYTIADLQRAMLRENGTDR